VEDIGLYRNLLRKTIGLARRQ